MTKSKLYWLFQIGGWGIYALVQIIGMILVLSPSQSINFNAFIPVIIEAVIFLIITHFYRNIINQQGWLEMNLSKLLPRIIVSSLILALPVYPLRVGVSVLLDIYDPGVWTRTLGNYFINTFVLFLWSLFYFSYHYFERYSQSLKHEAAVKEIELVNLKAQLNPHFIFNSLNSIRALVDENPKKSKTAITQLSNILRNSLIADKKKLTNFEEEFKLVKDYLALESTRYEERLRTEFEIHPDSNLFLLPPLMLQTLVENGIKHGISNLKKGGVITLRTKIFDDHMKIEIINSGQLKNGYNHSEGIGLKNTAKRLDLLYGDNSKFEIANLDDQTVLTTITIPQIRQYESINS